MNCRQVEPLLSDYLEGLLPERRADRLADHVRACSACRRLLDEFLAVGAALRGPMELPPLPGMERRIAERWLADREAIRSRGHHRLAVHLSGPRPPPLLPAIGLAIL